MFDKKKINLLKMVSYNSILINFRTNKFIINLSFVQKSCELCSINFGQNISKKVFMNNDILEIVFIDLQDIIFFIT